MIVLHRTLFPFGYYCLNSHNDIKQGGNFCICIVLKCNILPDITLVVPLPVNDIIEGDRLSIGVKIYLLLKLVAETYCPQMVQQLYKMKRKDR